MSQKKKKAAPGMISQLYFMAQKEKKSPQQLGLFSLCWMV